ncbi:MAG: hypothetical protein IJ523_03830 [Succinivibrionaceae bacterium]|nr:hypothetical protein [Succinivibrionaceae bacterium]
MKLLKSKLSVAVTMAVFGAALAACGGHHHHGGNGGGDEGTTGNTADWAKVTEDSNTGLVRTIPALSDTCVIDKGTVAVMGDVWDEYAAWIWDPNNDNANLYDDAAWPGEEFTDEVVDTCENAVIRNVLPPLDESEVAIKADGTGYKSINGYSIIINNNGGGAQTADLKELSYTNNCVALLKQEDGSVVGELVTARECGVQLSDGSVTDADVKTEIYAYNGNTKLAEGDTISFTEVSGKDDTKSVSVTLLIKGLNVTEKSTGYLWFNNDSENKVQFTNGAVVSIGEGFTLEDGQQVKGVLHLQYMEADADGNETEVATASYNFIKSYSEKDEEARQTKQEETLGATYTAEKTTFRIWSPDSSDVKVNVDGTDYEMKKVKLDGYGNVYEVAVEGDLVGKTYQFSVGGKNVRDPYGKMVAKGSDTANIVMDMSQTEPDDGWADTPALKNREDAVIYEVHVRDFTIDATSGVDADKRGRYLGMVQTGTTNGELATGIDHLKELGVTHVQLQPIYDYGTCSDVDSQATSCYNWGYDPWNYNVPEERYSSFFGTDKYNEKIKEVKTMVNEFHKNGIRVIMDVVYNHTWNKTVFEDITKKYYTGDNDLSGCGNAIDGDNNLVWMMIRDSMDYWVTEYHIDGFRLDLVGVFGIKDFSDWGKYLNAQHPDANLLIYGEPWTGGGDDSVLTDPVRTGRMWMQDADAHVGAFNNKYRNCLKSASDSGKSAGDVSKLGFIFNHVNTDWDGNGTDENGKGIEGNMNCVFMGMKAGVRTKDAPNEVKDPWSAQGFSDPEQTITYITAHDNLALRDKIEDASIDGVSLYKTDAEKKNIQVYANSALMVSQGITFIHGGEEIGRTKAAAGTTGESPMWNTYKTTSGANDFKWDLKSEWKDVFDSYAAYIKMRKDHPAFHMTTADLINANVTLDAASTDEVVIVNIDGTKVGDKWGTIKVVLNSTTSAVAVDGVSSMTKVADGVTVKEEGLTNDGKAAASAVSIWMTPNDSTGPVNFPALFLIGNITDWSMSMMLVFITQLKKSRKSLV